MHRTIFLISLTVLLLAACAPRQNVIESGVSGTLTALAPTAILPLDRPTSTLVPILAPPTSSPIPTATSAGGPTPTESPAENATPETTSASALPTVAATLALEPPAAGELIFEDKFDSPGPWSVGEVDDSNVAVSGGVMTFTQKTPGSFSFRIIGRQGGDFYAELSAALADRCATGDRYGLMFRVQDPSNYYLYQIDCDGRYRFARYVGGAATAIVDWTASPAIARGTAAANTLAVTARGDTFLLIVNGTPLTTAADSAFAGGRFGLLVGANVTRNFAVLFDNLKVNKLP